MLLWLRFLSLFLQSGSFVLAKADLVSNKNKTSSKGKSDVESSPYPTLWRIDGKALLQKFLPFEEDGKVLYKSTTTVCTSFFRIKNNIFYYLLNWIITWSCKLILGKKLEWLFTNYVKKYKQFIEILYFISVFWMAT